jgi:hypothetical protein
MPTRCQIAPIRLCRFLFVIAFLLGAGNAGVVSAQDIAEPSGIGEAVTAGPWSMTVQQVLLGDEAGADES